MEQQRPLLYLMLAFISFMIWSSWQSRNQPQQQPTPTVAANTAQINQASGVPAPSANTAADLPSMPNNAPQVASSASSGSDAGIIRVKTDVLDVLISLRGGTVIQSLKRVSATRRFG